MITGFYDKVTNTAGADSTNICYYNHVVNLNGGDPNDVRKYTKDNYIFELLEMLRDNPTTSFFIHLPVFQVYNNLDGSPVTLVDWWKDIVETTCGINSVAGYYVADEPEIYGSEYSDQPEYPYEEVLNWKLNWYDKNIKEILLPLVAVFCDVEMLRKKSIMPIGDNKCREISELDWWVYVFNLDIFGFDFYPLQTQEQVDNRGLGFQIGTSKEWTWIEDQFKSWRPIIQSVKNEAIPIMYVGQGCGKQDWLGRPNWGQRDFTTKELWKVFDLYRKHLGMPNYHLLWSYSRSDFNIAIETSDYIEGVLLSVKLPKKTRTLLQKIGNVFKGLFTWKS